MRTAGKAPERSKADKNLQRTRGCRQKQIKKKGKRRILLAFVAMTWCLLLVNIVFLIKLHNKEKNTEEQSERVMAEILQQLNEEYRQDSVRRETKEYQKEAESAAIQPIPKDYPDIWGLEWVDKPEKRTEAEILERLTSLAEDNSLIAEICENRKRYPDKMLEALANNPEMAGFIAGYLKGDKRGIKAGLTESEREKTFPLFLQWDPRWGYEEYGDDSNIGISGCGPTCVSMALYYLTGDESLTPDRIADYSMKNGYYVTGVGTAWALLEDVPALYGINVTQQKIREYNLNEALDEGSVIICSMSEGDFTVAGHFIVIYGYDSEGYLVNDPNCVARSREHWPWDRLEKQIKNIWVYSTVGGMKVTDYSSTR